MNRAHPIRTLNWETDAQLYRLDPPLVTGGLIVTHVIVSTIPAEGGTPGSLVLAATANGEVASWDGVTRSQHTTHTAALADLGYEVSE